MTSVITHQFREFCLSLLAEYPALVLTRIEKSTVHVFHSLPDKQHTFGAIPDAQGPVLRHSWGGTSHSNIIGAGVTAVQAFSSLLELKTTEIWITPHLTFTRLMPIWAEI
ncbi:hypothetical protein PC129_g24163 [Phytophthora cactorum]|uniref:Uncharacterized protein n=1 Tax=Phytophthora cactorum TaxID=29920 RepID=A0A8T0YTN0_9STRA|nr:hypothetical protein Pcac1_g21005 [Phytophthora cactorum]KAG2787908.1 hypothetical protein PC111_g24246 [Phytophthora cactorum]KAG2790309.1 hypothetical protein PC112_g24388 [Phytophthora cactorum]KAG2850614.1 hypothetical protein PC113_g16629 [Phytophthora cactorum]KAG2876979.1 hypothetical protein PC115_g23480 [Phytophthora cactorum]